MATTSDAATTILDAALTLAEGRGWQRVTLAAIAAETGLNLAQIHAQFRSKDAILAAFNRRIDAQVLSEPIDQSGSVRDRLFDLIMRRFDALGPHRAAIRAILRGTVGDPIASLCGLCAVHTSMATTLEAAGVSASGPLGRLKVKALSALYLRSLYQWLRGEGDDDRIMAQLDRALARAEEIMTSFASRHERLRERRRARRAARSRASDMEENAAAAADASEQA
jgi:AcrR family transcriptional regulator